MLQVLHFHLILGVQDLLRLRIYVASVSHTDCCHRLRHHRLHVLLAECGGLSMVCVVIRSCYINRKFEDKYLHTVLLQKCYRTVITDHYYCML